MNGRIGARVALAHTQHDYAAMLLARGEAGDRERAIPLLKASLESAREIGMRALEERVAARLNELGPARPAAAANDDLTAREAEVLRLIAIGRSNADIAIGAVDQPQHRGDARPQHPRQDRLRQPHRGRRLCHAPRPSAPLARML